MAALPATPVQHEVNPRTESCAVSDMSDPDITGFGVLISFIFSIVIVFVAIIWAYVKDTLPEKCYNEFDNLILNRKVRSDDGERVRSFQSFILAMSDQQLVSGLALAVSINVIRNGVKDLDTKISSYAYSSAVILAFFSCIIHLATIAVLREYLRDRNFLKHTRVIIMICVVGLLLQGLAESWYVAEDITLRCAMEGFTFLWDSPSPDATLWNVGNVFEFSIMLGLLTSGYVYRIRELYIYGRDFPASWMVHLLKRTIGWPEPYKPDLIAARRKRASKLALNIQGLSRICFLIIPESFSRSFMFEILWLIFYFAFGMCQVIYSILGNGYEDVGNFINFEPKFGQLLPLVLMVLPFLVMAEGYSDLTTNGNRDIRSGSSGPAPGPSATSPRVPERRGTNGGHHEPSDMQDTEQVGP
ncbi:hypothetical protein F5B20DRAFT_569137 [Whalleya microplaca]|nr:hypothetical protein F5B20DRAFT_569137 [Whalleya microplaca]